MTRKLMVLSVDSLFTSDLEAVRQLPGFKEVLSDCVLVKNIECIYPTLTYPCHTTMITGQYPMVHGVCHNERLDPYHNNQKWYWEYESIQVPTIFDYARKAQLKTAAFSWPVTSKAPIDLCVPEIWNLTKVRNNHAMRHGASLLGKTLYDHNQFLLHWKDNKSLDTFSQACALEAIRTQKPDVLFMHHALLDHARHVGSIHSKEVDEALLFHGEFIENLIEAYKDNGDFENTTFVILGDHGQLNVRRVVSINEMLRRRGLIETDGLGHITHYQAYVQSAGISGHVLIEDESVRPVVLEVLEEALNRGYIEKMFTAQECEKMGLNGVKYAIEGAPSVSIGNMVDGDIVQEIDENDYKNARATHGHLPQKGDKPMMIIYNSKQPAKIVEEAKLIDFMPTFLQLLELNANENLPGKSLL